jgi:hypothetical protein
MTRDTFFRAMSLLSVLFLIVLVGAAFWVFGTLSTQAENVQEDTNRLKERIQQLADEVAATEKQLQHLILLFTPAEIARFVKGLDENNLPEDVVALLPKTKNTEIADLKRIEEFAKQCDLLDDWQHNPHLKFKGGDLSWWTEQKLPSWELQIEFLARKMILDEAEHQHIGLDGYDQGALSALATMVYPVLWKKAQKLWK